jgi:serine carboxypeptidase-like clade I
MKSFLIFSLLTVLGRTANLKHRVEKTLPGGVGPLMTTELYSGFYNMSTTRHVHFVLVESQNSPKTDPLIVYFSGGPGTPSINRVFDSGVGPVMNGPNDTFVASPNTWCRNASVLFVDNRPESGTPMLTGC